MNALWYSLRRLPLRAANALDLPLLLALLALMAIGMAVLHSASGERTDLLISQALRFAVGVAAMLLIAQIPPARIRVWTPWIYAGTLLLLMLVPVFGSGRSGRHWLDLGVFYLQPAELLKLSVPMMVAWIIQRRPLPPGWRVAALSAIGLGIPTLMIAAQPDLGTAVPVAASGILVIFLAGFAWWRIALLGGAALAMAPFGWMLLKEYQRARLLTFMNPEADPLGTGWNIMQSKVAVGSGGLLGKGWGNGSQAHLDFLPEQTTDFIFAVLSEEFGWLGVCIVLALYLFIVGRCLWIAAQSRDCYSRLLAGSLALTFFVYVFVNGGMISGLLPVVGVPMPLLSYGGTSAVSLLAGFGVVMSVHAHRKLMGP
ncbi:MAG: rod shape-determining protein RodA [Xanthomonadaceae bacterium]|nr:rod shape-determining protein RodA [Xanthomonadaceae bacterium]MDP2186072.1 rod shape-determining protein RodA [Xanthomonadales bacterium]MDZ4117467.1 rod shape-determining protein RodA [Xanthomonadaceae bacterium]MDZ4378952.1 rod shape-determining protein RodA [Xanthomonadaceae bacterium]